MLLARNRIAAFHTLLESMPPALAASPHVQCAVELRAAADGRLVPHDPRRVCHLLFPDPMYAHFVHELAKTSARRDGRLRGARIRGDAPGRRRQRARTPQQGRGRRGARDGCGTRLARPSRATSTVGVPRGPRRRRVSRARRRGAESHARSTPAVSKRLCERSVVAVVYAPSKRWIQSSQASTCLCSANMPLLLRSISRRAQAIRAFPSPRRSCFAGKCVWLREHGRVVTLLPSVRAAAAIRDRHHCRHPTLRRRRSDCAA